VVISKYAFTEVNVPSLGATNANAPRKTVGIKESPVPLVVTEPIPNREESKCLLDETTEITSAAPSNTDVRDNTSPELNVINDPLPFNPGRP
jgi:hypothetical protein